MAEENDTKKPIKKKIDGKKKGGSFERHMAKSLSIWFSDGMSDNMFSRTAGSGARHTIRKKNNKDSIHEAGDIRALENEGKLFTDVFLIELKAYQEVDIWGLISNNTNCLIAKWWNKLNIQAKELEKLPLLIVRQNNKPILFISNHEMKDRIIFFFGNSPDLITKEMCIYKLDTIYELDLETFKAMLLDMLTI